jgi:HSP20 family molecular chaperone IbpA
VNEISFTASLDFYTRSRQLDSQDIRSHFSDVEVFMLNNILKNRIVVLLAGVLLGAGAVSFGTRYENLRAERHPNVKTDVSKSDDFFADDFFKMQERMMKHFDQGAQFHFDSGTPEINQREDDHYVYYDVSLQGVDPKDVNLKIENGEVSLSGKTKKTVKNGDSESAFESTFHREFPVPDQVDEQKVQIDQAQDKLIVKFPKVKA